MVRSSFLVICASALLGLVPAAFSSETDVVITPTGYGSLEFGQIGKGFFRPSGLSANRISHIWQQRAICVIGYKAVAANRLEMNISGGGLFAYSTPQTGEEPTTMQKRAFFYIQSANALLPIGNKDNPFLRLQIGYFPFKYNPDARNLGEYLFRTNTYPLVIYSDFDYAQSDLLGLRVNANLFNGLLTNDFLLHSEMLGVPVQDWSISDIVGSSFLGMFNVSAGVSFTHFLSVYQGSGYLPEWADSYYGDPRRLGDSKRYYRIIDGEDTTYIDWKAIKTMFRFSIDPRRFIPLDFFGKNDLKLYAEGDIIGLKNYRPVYSYIEDRTIGTVGFNWPTHPLVSYTFLPGLAAYFAENQAIDLPTIVWGAAGLMSGAGAWYAERFLNVPTRLDILNIELEYCANRKYPYSDELYFARPPTPMPLKYSDLGISRNPWRWSVYCKKNFLNDHLSIIAQVARDHKKINFYYFQKSYMSFIETLPDGDNWWWTFKTEFKF